MASRSEALVRRHPFPQQEIPVLQSTLQRLAWIGLCLVLLPGAFALAGPGRQLSPQAPADELVQRVVNKELSAQAADRSHWMFRMRHQESGVDVAKDVIETNQGNLERLVERNGKPLDAAEQKKEDRRIQALIGDPDRLRKKEQERKHDARQAQSLLRILPHAMLFTEQDRRAATSCGSASGPIPRIARPAARPWCFIT
jgi:hypothetical protein